MEEMNIITLTDAETMEKVELEIVEDLTIDGEHYVILAPLDEEDDAYVYKVIREGEKASYEMVDDEDEFNRVVEEYNRIFEEEMDK
ncbi:DUF1292 domain-containing protein [Clostridium sp. UBA1056]|uniref:DUF1292 domain-containing protein n=1 Tax=unclassified Clostridium TaxID=2614128 RepID=UPI0032165A3C